MPAKFDMREVSSALDTLAGPVRESLARRMAVSGGRVIRDEARLRAPTGPDNHWPETPRGAWGVLKESINVAFSDKRSSGTVFTYSVSWNDRLTPQGHWVEFGHWMPYAYRIVDGKYVTDKSRPLPGKGHWVEAQPFLRPAWEARQADAYQAMIERGKQELPILLAGGG